MLEIVCAWCGKRLGFKKASPTGGEGNEEAPSEVISVTHSICGSCAEKALDQLETIHAGVDELV